MKSNILVFAVIVLFFSGCTVVGFNAVALPSATPVGTGQTDYVFVTENGAETGPAYVKDGRPDIAILGEQIGSKTLVVGIILLLIGAIHERKINPNLLNTDNGKPMGFLAILFGGAVGSVIAFFAGGVLGALLGMILGFFI